MLLQSVMGHLEQIVVASELFQAGATVVVARFQLLLLAAPIVPKLTRQQADAEYANGPHVGKITGAAGDLKPQVKTQGSDDDQG